MPVRHCDIWARDAGPIWLRHRGSGARRMVKPTYTLWGYLVGGPRGRGHVDGPWASCDVPNTVPDQLAPLLGVPVEDASPFKTEGGDKSFNGRGTVLMSLAVERQRHPGLSVASIEKLARTHLKAAHVVWIDQGVQDDEQSFRGPLRGGANGEQPLYTAIGTGGHVDEAARFVGPRTVVVPQLTAAQAAESRVGAVTAARMDANAKLLEGQTDEAGRPLRVERMPFPEELTLKVNRSDEVFTLLMQLPELGIGRRRRDRNRPGRELHQLRRRQRRRPRAAVRSAGAARSASPRPTSARARRSAASSPAGRLWGSTPSR